MENNPAVVTAESARKAAKILLLRQYSFRIDSVSRLHLVVWRWNTRLCLASS